MARQNKGPGERGARGKVKEENDRVYGDYDYGGYDEEDYKFEGGYDDEEYEDYDTSFDEDDASWTRRQEQFEGVTRDERRRKLIRSLYRQSKMRRSNHHRGEFNEGYESEYEREFDREYEGEARGKQLAAGSRQSVANRRSKTAGGGARKTAARTKSRK